MLVLKLERFSDDQRAFFNSHSKIYGEIIGNFQSTSWVSEITDFDKKFKYKRVFVNGQWDYSEANSIGSRGIFVYYHLEENKIYDVKSQTSWNNFDRYFCQIKNGEIVKITEKEVDEWVKDMLVEMCIRSLKKG